MPSNNIGFQPPVSFYKSYNAAVDGGGNDGAQLGGQNVRAASGGNRRAALALSSLNRLGDRIEQKFADFCAKRGVVVKRFRSANADDRVLRHRLVRFNLRHERFSSRMRKVVDRLKTANSDLPDRDGTLKTLRNDMRLMHRDNPRATEFESLESRLDVELSQLSDKEVNDFVDNITRERDRLAGHVMADTRHGNDLRVLNKMYVVALRHQIARSSEMGSALNWINTAHAENAADRGEIRKDVEALQLTMKLALLTKSGSALSDKELAFDPDFLSAELLQDAVRLRVERDDPDEVALSQMNRNLLNVSHAIRQDIKQSANNNNVRLHPYKLQIAGFSPALRALNRAVRQAHLRKMIPSRGFTDKHTTSPFRRLDSGAAHTVSKVNYKHDIRRSTKVFKGDDETLMHPTIKQDEFGRPYREIVGFAAPAMLRLDQSSPRLLERAVAASELDRKLGFGINTRTNFALHEDQPGLVMDLAKGKIGGDNRQMAKAIKADRGEVQRQLVQLQLLDSLIAQTDRHRGNYMVHVQGANVRIVGIDSDYCLGPYPSDPGQLAGKPNLYFSLPALPPVIDSDMLKAIRELGDEDLLEVLGGSFSDATIAAAKSRLQVIKAHAEHLSQNGAVIAPNEWGTRQAEDLLADRTVLNQSHSTARFRLAATGDDPSVHSQSQTDSPQSTTE